MRDQDFPDLRSWSVFEWVAWLGLVLSGVLMLLLISVIVFLLIVWMVLP